MNESAESKPKYQFAALTALLLATTPAANVFAESRSLEPFTMAVFIDARHGKKINSGMYDQAIDKITRGGTRESKRFEDQVNLCVAYAKTNSVEKANAACNAAIEKVEKRAERSNVDVEARVHRYNLALALSNRGVLMAASGETDLAEKDFLAALELDTQLTWIVENNLARLNQGTQS